MFERDIPEHTWKHFFCKPAGTTELVNCWTTEPVMLLGVVMNEKLISFFPTIVSKKKFVWLIS